MRLKTLKFTIAQSFLPIMMAITTTISMATMMPMMKNADSHPIMVKKMMPDMANRKPMPNVSADIPPPNMMAAPIPKLTISDMTICVPASCPNVLSDSWLIDATIPAFVHIAFTHWELKHSVPVLHDSPLFLS